MPTESKVETNKVPTLQFTKNGRPLGRLIPAPLGANDIKIVWGPRGIVAAWWTRNCQFIFPPIPVPPGANDAHVDVRFTAAPRVLKEGMNGEDVLRLQEELEILGFDVNVDGTFGPDTTKAVAAFQQRAGLPADGIVSVETAQLLNAAATDAFVSDATLTSNDILSFMRLSFVANVQDEGPQHRAWRERLRQAFAARMRAEGIDENEIEKILTDTFLGLFGIGGAIRNLWKQINRLRKVLRAFKKAKEDAGPEPAFNQ